MEKEGIQPTPKLITPQSFHAKVLLISADSSEQDAFQTAFILYSENYRVVWQHRDRELGVDDVPYCDVVIWNSHAIDMTYLERLMQVFPQQPIVVLLESPLIMVSARVRERVCFLERDSAGNYWQFLPTLVNQLHLRWQEHHQQQTWQDAYYFAQRRYRSLVENSPDIILTLSMDGTILSLNPAFSEFTGWIANEWIGKPFIQLVHPQDYAVVEQTIQQVAKGSSFRLLELQIATANQAYIVCEFTLFPQSYTNQLASIFGIARDITSHVAAQRALAQERDRMALLLESVPCTIAWISSDLTYIAVNKFLATLYDLQPQDYVGRALGFDAPMAVRNSFQEFMKAFFQSADPQETVEIPVQIQGHLRYFYLIATQHKETEAIVIGVDITDLRLAQESQKRQLKELAILHEVALLSVQMTNENTLIEKVTGVIGRTFVSNNFGVVLHNEGSNFLVAHPSYRFNQPYSTKFISINEGITGYVTRTGESIRIDDVSNHPLYLAIDPQVGSELCVPMKVGGRVIGVINAESVLPYAFTIHDEQLLTTLAGQLAIAIERLRREENERYQAQQLATIYAVGQRITAILDNSVLWDEVVRLLVEKMHFYNAAIGFIDGEKIAIKAGYGGYIDDSGFLGDVTPQISDPTLAPAILLGKPYLVENVQEMPNYKPYHRLPNTHAHLAVPLRVQTQIIGILAVARDRPFTISAGDVALLEILADQVTIAMQNARLFAETTKRRYELEVLAEISAMVRAAGTVDEILSVILPKSAGIVQAIRMDIFLVEPETGDLVARAEYPNPIGHIPRRHHWGQGITGYVAQTGQPYLFTRLQDDSRVHFIEEEKAALAKIGGGITLPLRAENRIVGVMHVALAEERALREDEVHILTAIADIAGTALYRAQITEQLEQHIVLRTMELQEANERLQMLDRIKSKFVTDMSHELRTPITNLNLYMDLLTRGRPEKREHYLSVLRATTERLMKIVETLLDFSHLEHWTGKMMPVNLVRLVKKSIEQYEPAAHQKGLNLSLQVEEQLLLVLGDSEQLSQMIGSLLDNAIKYTIQGKVAVMLSYNKERKQICLTVQDTGVGILPDEQPLVFEKLYRGEVALQLNVPGAGLGLNMVQEVVTRYGGQVQIESDVGQGTTVRVWLLVYDRQNEKG